MVTTDKPKPRFWPVIVSLVLAIIGVRSFQTNSIVVGILCLAAAIIVPFYFETTRKARLAMISLVVVLVALRYFAVHRHPLSLVLLLGAFAIPLVFDLKDAKRYYRKHPASSVLTGLTFVGLAAAMGGFEWFPPLEQWAIFKDSLKYSLPLATLSTFIALRLERQSSPRTKLAEMLIASLFAFTPLGAGIEILLNGWLDTSTPTAHLTRVLDRHTSTSRRRSNSVQVESWRKATELETLHDVPRSIYNQAGPDGTTRMKVLTKPGRFGFEWLVSYEVE